MNRAVSIARIVQTCAGHPSQWEGFMADGQAFYIRFRHGNFSVYVHPTDPLKDDAPIIDEMYVSPVGGDGYMEYDELRGKLAAHGIETPPAMEDESKWHKGIIAWPSDATQEGSSRT